MALSNRTRGFPLLFELTFFNQQLYDQTDLYSGILFTFDSLEETKCQPLIGLHSMVLLVGRKFGRADLFRKENNTGTPIFKNL